MPTNSIEAKASNVDFSSISRRDFLKLLPPFLVLLTSCGRQILTQETQTQNCPEWTEMSGQCLIRTETKSVNGMAQIFVKEGEQCLITVYSPSLVNDDDTDQLRIQKIGQFVTNKSITIVSLDPETSLTQYKAEWAKNLSD